MSTKMNFGPEWMRSAPAQSKQAAANGGSINSGPSSASELHGAQPAAAATDDAAVPADARRYTHEMMLQLFKPQGIAHDFVASEHVFSSAPLEPISLTEPSAKEQDLLAGPINSGSSKRYNNNGNQQQQQQMQMQTQTQQNTQYYSRNSSGMQRTGSYGPMPGSSGRAKHRDDSLRINEKLDHGPHGSDLGRSSAALGNGVAAPDDEESLWAHQSLARESVGSFGADGVFRMSAADDGELLEAPSSRNSARGEGLRDLDGFASGSGSASPAVNSVSRVGAAGMLSRSQSQQRIQARLAGARSPLGNQALSTLDASVWSLGDPGNRPLNALQQHRLVERAEQIKWWYRDPQGNIQGPFSAANMQDWYSADYFPADLQVCFEGRSEFEPLSNVIARAGDSANIFLYSALAFVAQSFRQQRSGISTPVTPASMSRAASAIQLASLGPDVSAPLPAATAASAAAAAAATAVSASTSAADLLLGNMQTAALPHGSAAGLVSSVGALAGASAYADLPPASSPNSGMGASASASANANANANASARAGAEADSSQPASQAMQLSALLNEQLLLVSAIGDRQRNILGLQEQLQQSLAKLMQELAQETNAIHYRAQIENLPIQTELLFALQQRAQAAEEKLRLEIAHLTQVQAAQISQLEAKIDPVIKDIVLRNGTAYALNFIYQQLQELDQQIAREASQKPSDAAQDAQDAPVATAPTQPVDESTKKHTPRPSSSDSGKAQQQAQQQKSQATADTDTDAIDKAQKGLGEMSVSDSARPKSDTAAKEGLSAKTATSKKTTDNAAAPASSSKTSTIKGKAGSQSAAASAAASASASVASPSQATKKPATSEAKPAEAALPKPAVLAAVSSPAPWSTGNKIKQPKKSLLQIQQEEEEAMKMRQQAEEQQRAQGSASRSFVGSYADRLGGGSSSANAPRSLAAIMEEQSKESAKNNTASTFSASVAATNRPDGLRTLTLAAAAAPAPAPAPSSQSSRTVTSPPSTSAWGAVSAPSSGKNNAASFALSAAAAAASSSSAASGAATGSTHAAGSAAGSSSPSSRAHVTKASHKETSGASITSTPNVAVMPSMQFLEWCHSRLGSLRGIDVTKFIEVLLTFPTQPAETTLEIIAEQIYAYSQTLNGRAFAEDFVARRRKDFGAVRNGSLKSAPTNWMQLLNKAPSDRTSVKYASASGSADFITVSGAGAPRNSSADSSFQVVGKKGRK